MKGEMKKMQMMVDSLDMMDSGEHKDLLIRVLQGKGQSGAAPCKQITVLHHPIDHVSLQISQKGE